MAYGSKLQNIWLIGWSNCWSARCWTMNWFMLWLEAKVVGWACSNSGRNMAQIDKKNYLDFSLKSYYCTPIICADCSCSHMNCEINDAIKWYIDKLCTLMQWFWDQFGGDVGIFSEVHLTRYLLTCVYTVLLKFVRWNLHCHWLVAVICSSSAAISRVGQEILNVPPPPPPRIEVATCIRNLLSSSRVQTRGLLRVDRSLQTAWTGWCSPQIYKFCPVVRIDDHIMGCGSRMGPYMTLGHLSFTLGRITDIVSLRTPELNREFAQEVKT